MLSNAQRLRPCIYISMFEDHGKLYVAAAEESTKAKVTAELVVVLRPAMEQTHADYIEHIYAKGTLWHMYGKLYKSTKSSDVLSHILDPWDLLDTLCESVLEYIQKEKAHNQVVLVIDKCNLIRNWVSICHLPVGDLAVLTPSPPCSQLLLIYEMSVPYIHAQS